MTTVDCASVRNVTSENDERWEVGAVRNLGASLLRSLVRQPYLFLGMYYTQLLNSSQVHINVNNIKTIILIFF